MEIEEDVLKKIGEAIKKIRYGAVEITVHDARVVQIECREKIRFEKNRNE